MKHLSHWKQVSVNHTITSLYIGLFSSYCVNQWWFITFWHSGIIFNGSQFFYNLHVFISTNTPELSVSGLYQNEICGNAEPGQFYPYPSGLLYWHCDNHIGNSLHHCLFTIEANMNMGKWFTWIYSEVHNEKATQQKTVSIFDCQKHVSQAWISNYIPQFTEFRGNCCQIGEIASCYKLMIFILLLNVH